MKEQNERIPLTKELKIMLLKALKVGYLNKKELAENLGISERQITIIDKTGSLGN